MSVILVTLGGKPCDPEGSRHPPRPYFASADASGTFDASELRDPAVDRLEAELLRSVKWGGLDRNHIVTVTSVLRWPRGGRTYDLGRARRLVNAVMSPLPVVRSFFDVTPRSQLAAFVAEAPRHPVFLLTDRSKRRRHEMRAQVAGWSRDFAYARETTEKERDAGV